MKSDVIVLVGPPMSGKDTYLRYNLLSSFEIISRDDIMMTLHTNNNYSEAFRLVDQKMVNKLLNQKIIDSITENKSVIINMTNLTSKGRKKHLSKFPSHYNKIAIVFPKLSMEEYELRNEKRYREENKFIPVDVLKNMIHSWEEVTKDEGFDQIIKL